MAYACKFFLSKCALLCTSRTCVRTCGLCERQVMAQVADSCQCPQTPKWKQSVGVCQQSARTLPLNFRAHGFRTLLGQSDPADAFQSSSSCMDRNNVQKLKGCSCYHRLEKETIVHTCLTGEGITILSAYSVNTVPSLVATFMSFI